MSDVSIDPPRAKQRTSPWTARRVMLACLAMMMIWWGGAVTVYAKAENGVLPSGVSVGGDYLAFYGAATAVRDGETASTYDRAAFEARLVEVGPLKERRGLTWQYPPTQFLLVAPLALFAFIPGYLVWTGGSALAFFATLRRFGLDGPALFVILASPSVMHAAITGQNGFFTAIFFAAAALLPDKRPVLAGLAAALLTMKPQLGLLIPVAYVAGGHWRAFGVAAAGSIALALAATLAFGIGAWAGFLVTMTSVSGYLEGAQLPLERMATPFAFLRHIGLATGPAAALHLVVACLAAIIVFRIWRKVPDPALRAAVLCAGAFLASPYGYYYELVILALPLALIAQRARRDGWLPFEQAGLAFVFLLPAFILATPRDAAFGLGFPVILLATALVLRRAVHEYPGLLPAGLRPRVRPALPMA